MCSSSFGRSSRLVRRDRVMSHRDDLRRTMVAGSRARRVRWFAGYYVSTSVPLARKAATCAEARTPRTYTDVPAFQPSTHQLASATMSRRKGLLDLPNELLMMIKHELDPYDILGNMCYYTLSARTKACYDDTTEDQWRQMVRANGLGLVTGEDTFDADWEAIAVECAEHAWQCTHPGCGVAQIQTNRASLSPLRSSSPKLTVF